MKRKFHVSLEAARLLKEKGYNEKCIFAYADTSNGSDINGRIVFNSNDYPIGFYPCPTKAEAIDWLESKGIVVEILRDYRRIWYFYISDGKNLPYLSSSIYSNRLEAEEAAIIKACELL